MSWPKGLLTPDVSLCGHRSMTSNARGRSRSTTTASPGRATTATPSIARRRADCSSTRQARREGSGRVALCRIDPLTQIDHSSALVDMPIDGVLIVDGVFAFRPQFDACWDLRIWVHIDPELSVRRGMVRDADMEGGAERAEALHRGRYLAAETIYIDELDPMTLAEVAVDNTDVARPLLMRGS